VRRLFGPKHLETELTRAGAARLGDGPALAFLMKVMLQQRLEVVLGVSDVFPAVAQVNKHLAVGGLLEEEAAGRQGLAGTEVPFAADAAVENDAGPGKQLAVVLAENAGCDHNSPTFGKGGQAAHPPQALTLHGWLAVADEEHVDVARPFGPGFIEEGTPEAEQVGGAALRQAGAG
jgi:hypothetical protein